MRSSGTIFCIVVELVQRLIHQLLAFWILKFQESFYSSTRYWILQRKESTPKIFQCDLFHFYSIIDTNTIEIQQQYVSKFKFFFVVKIIIISILCQHEISGQQYFIKPLKYISPITSIRYLDNIAKRLIDKRILPLLMKSLLTL